MTTKSYDTIVEKLARHMCEALSGYDPDDRVQIEYGENVPAWKLYREDAHRQIVAFKYLKDELK